MTLDQLLRLEHYIESAWCTILKDAGGNAIPEFSDEKAPRPVYLVKLQNVAETNKKFIRKSDGRTFPHEWSGTLATRTVTKRFQNSSDQADMIARVRISAFHFLDLFNEATLPYHWVTWMKEVNTVRTHILDGEWDHTEQSHEIKFQIKDECLPE